jgi:hypothetical protein
MPERIAHLVFLDAFAPTDGQSTRRSQRQKSGTTM